MTDEQMMALKVISVLVAVGTMTAIGALIFWLAGPEPMQSTLYLWACFGAGSLYFMVRRIMQAADQAMRKAIIDRVIEKCDGDNLGKLQLGASFANIGQVGARPGDQDYLKKTQEAHWGVLALRKRGITV